MRVRKCTAPSAFRRLASPSGPPGRAQTHADAGQLQRNAGNTAVLRLLQSRASHATPDVSPGLESYVERSRGGGRPLPAATRAAFEPRLDRDLGDVRLHADSRAASATAEIGARAFTKQSDIYFGTDQLRPGTAQGDRLLAHELAHVAQQKQRCGAIQRQPISTTAETPTPAIYRESVQDAIRFFDTGASFYGRPSVSINRAIFDRVMSGWHGMVVGQESIIDTQFRGDAALKRALQAAYLAAIRVVMTKAATALHKTEDDLYRENSGRIPLWAWQTAHHMERGISTPIAQGRSANRAGNVVFTSNGFQITIRPNGIRTGLRTSGITEIDLNVSAPGRSNRSGQMRVAPLRAPTVSIQIFYRSAAAASAQSAYGRGTTTEDIAGGAVTPRNTTVGFHEGAHGLAFVEFLEKNPPPQFTGTAAMTSAAFNAAQALYLAQFTAYSDRLKAFSRTQVHCVGTTIDQHNRAQARAGVRIVLECGP